MNRDNPQSVIPANEAEARHFLELLRSTCDGTFAAAYAAAEQSAAGLTNSLFSGATTQSQ